jgi:hypothetical protein
MDNLLIQISKSDLENLIRSAVRDALPTEIKQATPQPFIKGIHELAKFLQVSPARAQKLKNEGHFPFWQDGRTLLFDPDKVRQSMETIKKGR